MNYPPSTPEISQGDVDNLLTQLQRLRSAIAGVREEIAPLETNLSLAYEEFQAVVGSLHRHSMRLQAEIFTLSNQIELLTQADEVELEDDSSNQLFSIREEEITESSLQDPEAVAKDTLLEHIFRVLDPDINDEDAELVAHLQGLCSDATASLADILSEVPWGLVWKNPSPQENLTQQYQRLSIWQEALNKQLKNLQQATERLKNDRRYGLWQQCQKGQKHWHNFLNQCLQQQQDQNDELQVELYNLKEEWTRITSSTNHL